MKRDMQADRLSDKLGRLKSRSYWLHGIFSWNKGREIQQLANTFSEMEETSVVTPVNNTTPVNDTNASK